MGSKGDSTTQVIQTDIPEYFQPYAEDIMTRATAVSTRPYVPYDAERIAPVSPDTLASEAVIRGIAAQGMPQTQAAIDYTGQMMGYLPQVMQGGPYQFDAYGGFQQGQADPYAGFQETQVDPYAGFQAYGGFEDQSGIFQPGQVSEFRGFRAGEADPYAGFEQYGGFQAGRARAGQFTKAGTATAEDLQSYMDPYRELVTDRMKERIREDYERSREERSARAVSAGAFGGSRQAVEEGVAERGMLDRLAQIEAEQGSAAFQQARSAFEADRAARLQTEQAQIAEIARTQGISIQEAARVQQNQAQEAARFQEAQAQELARTQGISIDEARRVQQDRAAEFARAQGLSVQEGARVQAAVAQERARIQNADASEFARIQQAQAQELARVQGISVDEAARVQQQEAAEIARVQGISIQEAARVQAANAAESARVQQAQAAEDMAFRNFQLQGMGFGMDMAGQLAQLGEAARAGDIQAAQFLESIGTAQRAREQEYYDLQYQDFLRQQNYEQQQLAGLMGIMRGIPMGSIQTTQVPNNPAQQALGAGVAGLGLYQSMYS